MISSWNRQHTSIDSGALCAQFYTGGGYYCEYFDSPASTIIRQIRGYVCPFIYRVCVRQHRSMLSFLRVHSRLWGWAFSALLETVRLKG